MWKEKKSDKINNEDNGYSHAKPASFLVKWENSHFTKVLAPFFCKKTLLTIERECLFAARPDNYRGWLSKLEWAVT